MYTAPEMTAKQKAKNLRYKKPLLQTLNFDGIQDSLNDMIEQCEGIKWYMDDEETLLNALDGDEEEEFEFRLAFTDLSAECEQLWQLLNDTYVLDYFDELLVNMLGNRYKIIGYDSYEEDYFGLTGYEERWAQEETGKRLLRLTKTELLTTFRQCMGVVVSYLNIEQKYTYLKATIDIMTENNTSLLRLIKDIEEFYNAADEEDFHGKSTWAFDRLVDELEQAMPGRMWIE